MWAWPKLGQQQKHIQTTPTMMKDGEQQQNENSNKYVLFKQEGTIRSWVLKALYTMLEDTKDIKKYIGDIRSTWVKSILYFISFWTKGC
jgi:hypothetical protein